MMFQYVATASTAHPKRERWDHAPQNEHARAWPCPMNWMCVRMKKSTIPIRQRSGGARARCRGCGCCWSGSRATPGSTSMRDLIELNTGKLTPQKHPLHIRRLNRLLPDFGRCTSPMQFPRVPEPTTLRALAVNRCV